MMFICVQKSCKSNQRIILLGNNEHLLYIYRIESRTNTRTPDTEVMNFVHLAKDSYS